MHINIRASKIEMTPALEEFVGLKLQPLMRLLKQYENTGSALLEIEFARTTTHHKKGDVFYAEGMLKLPHGVLRAESTENDIHLAFQEMVKKLQGEIKKFKEKRSSKRRS